MAIDFTQILATAAKATPQLVFASAATSAVILFGPERFIRACRLAELRELHGQSLGIAFLGATFLFIAASVWPAVRTRGERSLEDLKRRKRLREATADEKFILRRYVERQSRAEDFNIRYAALFDLIREGILHKLTEEAELGEWPIGIADWAWDYLNKNQRFVGLPGKTGGRGSDGPKEV
jgi:Super-infection exclusion protein B